MRKEIAVKSHIRLCDVCLPKAETETKETCNICGKDICEAHRYEGSWNDGLAFCKTHLDDSPSKGTILRLFNNDMRETVDWIASVSCSHDNKSVIRRLLEPTAIGKYRNFAALFSAREDGNDILFANTADEAMRIVDDVQHDETWCIGILELKDGKWERIHPSRVKVY